MHNPTNGDSTDTRRGLRAKGLLVKAFQKAGWKVDRQPANGPHRPDMVVRRDQVAYSVEVKETAEGRADRLVPLWAQAWLQASRSAAPGCPPLAVVAAPKINRRAAERVLRFAAEYAPLGAAGVVDFEGLRLFRGSDLEELAASPATAQVRQEQRPRVNLFSDLNQWMLKVLLAPELPERLLSAPRSQYRNASQLAKAAAVSVMSAFRFLDQLRSDGYLDEGAPVVRLVRRDDLFSQWQAAAAIRSAREIPIRLLIRGDVREELRRRAGAGQFCLGLFAAADALGLGLVQGVPPHIYVRTLHRRSPIWKGFVPSTSSERPDAILRQASAPESVFRGSVVANGIPVSDVLQVWLDASVHPSRGAEQADLIRRRILARIISMKPSDG